MNCPNCGLKLSDPSFYSHESGTCPNCGHLFSGKATDAQQNPIAQYFDDLKSILFKPRSFFSRMPRNGGLTHPLAFALIAHWIGTALQYLWNVISARTGEEIFQRWAAVFDNQNFDVVRRGLPAARHVFNEWFWGAGSVVADPFLTLFSILVTSFFVFLGARLFVGVMTDLSPSLEHAGAGRPHEVTYESAVRIISYGAVASIFLAIPWYGSFIAWIYALYISVIGAKEVYRIGTGRALLVVLFPKILIGALFLALFTLLLFVGISLFGALFSMSF